MTLPLSVLADGNVKVVWVPALAAPTAPSAAELNGAAAVDLSCYLTGDGLSMSTDEQSVTDDRLCSTQTFQSRGRYTDGLEMTYIYLPQITTGTTNKAYTTLKVGTTGFVVVRWGMDYTQTFASLQIVDVLPAECGVQRKATPEANSKLKVMQKVFISGAVKRDAVVAV